MKHSISCSSWALMAAVLLMNEKCHSFSSRSVSQTRQRQRHCLDSSPLIVLSATPAEEAPAATTTATTPRKKPLSPEGILKQVSGEEEEAPKLFEDNLMDNMQQILLTIEKRVKQGPGSLSMLEVEEFVIMSQDLANEMKNFEYERLNDAGSSASSSSSDSQAAASLSEEAVAPVAETPAQPTMSTTPAVTEVAKPVATTTTTTTTSVDNATEPEIQKANEKTAAKDNEDGPAYDPRGGQGSLAKGTRNTYVIPNMDEMSPEEYQKALQASVIQQQEERKKKMGGYGNRQTWDYLNNLTGESGQLKSDSAFQD